MADTDYTEPLTGEEIIVDILENIAIKLRADCNLRDSDSYMGGYKAKIQLHIECYGLDTSIIDSTVESGEPDDELVPEVIHEDLDIPVEPDADAVRERSGQDVPTLSRDIEGKPEIKKRKYTRKVTLSGGATGEAL